MKNYTITKDQILELENGFTLPKLKEWFPDVFEVKLEVGKWYKDGIVGNFMFCFQGIYSNSNASNAYGFTLSGKWYENLGVNKESAYFEATEQEVFEALKNEAVKRGFKEGVYIDKLLPFNMGTDKIGFDKNQLESDKFYLHSGGLFCGNLMLMNHKGVWAEIIPTLTKKEAEEKLNCKIV